MAYSGGDHGFGGYLGDKIFINKNINKIFQLIEKSYLFKINTMKKLTLFLIILTIITNNIKSQFYNRIEANISVKTKYSNGKGTLEMGKVYFDKKLNKLTYDFTFPNKQQIVIFDTTIYIIKDKKLFEKQKTISFIKSTLFNIILNGDLMNYGMKDNKIYKPSKVVKENGLVITTWAVPIKDKKIGDILIATKNKDLQGVVFLNQKGEMLSKQIFSNYIIVSGLRFPTEITQIFYQNNTETYQVTTFKNVLINNQKNENFYNFLIPR